MNTVTEKRKPFFIRFIQYQKERFPFVQHGPLIVVFTFSAASYSRMCRGDAGFVALPRFGIGVVTALFFFLLLRICDEFKDFEDDNRYRPYRAVPRGLVSLKELAVLGVSFLVMMVLLNGWYMPGMLVPFSLVILYMFLMTREFFVPVWLKKHPMTYMASHMVIMPLIDGYTTGLDWLTAGNTPPRGVEIFLIVSFFNGIVIEVGRKIRAPEAEETGVETYSSLYGPVKATCLWFGSMLVTGITAAIACTFVGFGMLGTFLLIPTFVLCALPGILFVASGEQRYGKTIEIAAGVWTIGMYLIVGATPMIIQLTKTLLKIT